MIFKSVEMKESPRKRVEKKKDVKEREERENDPGLSPWGLQCSEV